MWEQTHSSTKRLCSCVPMTEKTGNGLRARQWGAGYITARTIHPSAPATKGMQGASVKHSWPPEQHGTLGRHSPPTHAVENPRVTLTPPNLPWQPIVGWSLANNTHGRLTQALYVMCTIYPILTINQRKEYVIQKIIEKRQYNYSPILSLVKNLCM